MPLRILGCTDRYTLVWTTGQYEMLGAARLVGIAGHFNRAVVRCGLAGDEPLRIECTRPAPAISHALGDAAAIGIDEPMKGQRLAKGNGAEIKVEPGDEHIVIGVEQVFGEEKEIADELTLIDGD